VSRLPYWKIWIFIILGLGGLRLITFAFNVPTTPASPPISESKPVIQTPAHDFAAPPHMPQSGMNKKAADSLTARTGAAKPSSNVANSKAAESILQTKNAVSAEPDSGTSTRDKIDKSFFVMNSPSRPDLVPPKTLAPDVSGDYFTIGSTKGDVLRVQGSPTRYGDYQWTYGSSTVDFNNDRVVSWNQFYGSPLKIKMLPSATAMSNAKGYFTLGSTKDEVLAVQGTPTKFGGYQWTYGSSTVDFNNDRVVSWNQFYGSPLKVKMVPSAAAMSDAKGYFTLGSTKDEVLAVQGTPTKFGGYQWTYGSSTVNFSNDRVVSWNQFYGSPLKAKKE
jgi:hypothetical protein